MKFLDSVTVNDQSSFDKLLKQAKETSTSFYIEVTLAILLKMFKNSILVPYEHNRSGNINKSRIKDMATNFKPSGFGQVTVSFHNGRIELVDAHHRVYTLVYMNDVLLTFNDFSSIIVTLHVVPSSERISTYQTLNAGKSHGGSDKIGNPDLAIGSLLEEVLTKAGVGHQFKKGHKQNLADLMITSEDYGTDFELENLFQGRGKINKLLDTAKDRRSFSVKDATLEKTSRFVQKYQSLVNFAEQDDLKAEVVALISSPGFFLTMGMDHMSNGKMLTGFSILPNKEIVKKIGSGNKFIKLRNFVRTIARRNNKEIRLDLLKNSLA